MMLGGREQILQKDEVNSKKFEMALDGLIGDLALAHLSQDEIEEFITNLVAKAFGKAFNF